MRYQWEIVQHGEISLRPDGSTKREREHCCSAVLLWPQDEAPHPANCLITDPCFIGPDTDRVQQYLNNIGIDVPTEIGTYYVTHSHLDHEPFWGDYTRVMRGIPYDHSRADLQTIPCPGHHPDQHALVFTDTNGHRVWIVGDAVLDEEWLIHWRYYWPNGYTREEIIATWQTIGLIIQKADLIIPGHGTPIAVTSTLIQQLIEGFPQAEYADQCPQIMQQLRERLNG